MSEKSLRDYLKFDSNTLITLSGLIGSVWLTTIMVGEQLAKDASVLFILINLIVGPVVGFFVGGIPILLLSIVPSLGLLLLSFIRAIPLFVVENMIRIILTSIIVTLLTTIQILLLDPEIAAFMVIWGGGLFLVSIFGSEDLFSVWFSIYAIGILCAFAINYMSTSGWDERCYTYAGCF